ncbi:MAG: tyrosine-type recombinase/integrase [Candidatus Micrarchaeaceae archaeon]
MSAENFPPHIADWIHYLGEQGRSPRTVANYALDLRDFCRWYRASEGTDPLPSSVLPRDIEDYKAYLQTIRRAAPRTVNRRLAALSHFFKWAFQNGLARKDPTAGVRFLRLPPRKPRALSPREERRLRRAVEAGGSARDRAVIEVLLGTGLRVEELLALRRGDVELHPRSGVLIVRRGKGGTTRRVPLTASVRRALGAYLEALGDLPEDAPLWQGTRGPLRDRGAVGRMLEKYARLAGLEGVTPHVLRHTFATRYLEANPGDLRGLAALLGHASLNTVMVYTEPAEEDLLEKMERMGVVGR